MKIFDAINHIPKIIYIQWYEDNENETERIPSDEPTWCEDQINDDDIKYVLASTKNESVSLYEDVNETKYRNISHQEWKEKELQDYMENY